jgi:acyl-CoA reductase-like NAD-dependent aldehyde dehydrogenase
MAQSLVFFGATGQSCVAGSRLYLQEDIADEFLDRMVGLAKDIVIGDPLADATQMGPLCTQGQMDCVEREVARALDEGGTLAMRWSAPKGSRR